MTASTNAGESVHEVVDGERSITLRSRSWRARAADGVPLVVLSKSPVDGPTHPEPLLLVHGLRGTRFNWNSSKRSLQNALVEAGYTVHAVELRGSGASREAGSPSPRSFIELLELDMEPLLERLSEEASSSVTLIGHSLGGIISSLAGSMFAEHVSRVVALASPLAIGVDQPLMRFGAKLWVAVSEAEPLREIAESDAMGRAMIRGRRVMERLSLNPVDSYLPGSMEPELEAEFEERGHPEPAFPGLLRDLSRLAIGKSPIGMEISDLLSQLRAPALCIAADADELAPVAAVRALYDALGSVDKEWVVAGEEGAHLGHVDMILGREAPRLVWSEMLRWLEEERSDGRV